ncbi:MAG: alpha/beta fold hydrolase [Actinomycetota bacterium]|nr:alpha/beta fold hydrolase [Actinomycetota bacterium]
MAERMVRISDEVELCIDEQGPLGGPLVLLVMGLGLQLVWWRDDFCAELVSRGFRVVRYDHRDIGRSTPFQGPVPGALGFLTRRAKTTYELEDMADDAGLLIAALKLLDSGAHVVGVSLGSFVAQAVAIRHPDRVRSLVSIMGRPGDRSTGKVAWRARPEFLRQGPRDFDGQVEHLVRTFHRIGSEGRTAEDDEDVRVALRRSAGRERGDGTGAGRQLAAILSERDRTEGLRGLDLPALVIHGLRDRVVSPSGGRATAAAIPGSELLEIEGMGHDLARWTWPQVIDGIERTTARAKPPPREGRMDRA